MPLVASVMTCSSLGVPSAWVPVTTVSQARAGLPVAAQITLRADEAAGALASEAATADRLTVVAATAGVVVGTDIRASVALVVERAPLFLFWCTTRSPPRTGRPL